MDTKIKLQLSNNNIIKSSDKKDPNVSIKLSSTKEKGDVLKQTDKLSPITKKAGIALPQFANKKLEEAQSNRQCTHEELVNDDLRDSEQDENAEVLDIPLPFRSIGTRSSLTNVHNLLQQCPQPQAPLVNKQLKTLQLNVDQAYIMAEQIKKMKIGMERLHSILQKCNSVDKFKQDIDFIILNIGPAMAKAEQTRTSKISVTKSSKPI